MCGIAGIYVKQPDRVTSAQVDVMLSALLEGIDHRGGHATGFVSLSPDAPVVHCRAACDVPAFEDERERVQDGARTVLAHTRWATQGHRGFINNAHPVTAEGWYVVHNGHIHNDDELIAGSGLARVGKVDSFAAVAALHAAGGNILAASETIDGDFAFGIVHADDPDTLAVVRGNSSPVVVLETRRVVLFASTASAVVAAHVRGIGALDTSRHPLHYLSEGTILAWSGGKRIVDTRFTPRTPSYWTRYSGGWSASGKPAAASASTFTRDDGDVDGVDCDFCFLPVEWGEITYVPDKDGRTCFLCPDCECDPEAYDALGATPSREALQRMIHRWERQDAGDADDDGRIVLPDGFSFIPDGERV